MADDGRQQRKPDFRTAVEDVKAVGTVLMMTLESVLGRRLKLRSPAVLAAIGVVATLALALVVVMALMQTGKANAISDNAALIGALVALGGVFTAQMVSIALDDRRSHEARDLEAQRAHETALRAYFEDVGELLIEKPLREASPDDHLSVVVRAQTLSVLEGLDPARKRLLLLFLYESGLIHERKPIVDLVAANLSEVNLGEAYLRGAYLNGTYLFEADLSGADLSEASLRGAVLSEANLSNANLSNANLSMAQLYKANLTDANLREALGSNVYLRDATLLGATLFKTDLGGANLRESDLGGANLYKATGITNEELEQQAASLEGATMPNGQKYEDWRKEKESSSKDVDNA